MSVALNSERFVVERTGWSYPRLIVFDEWLEMGDPKIVTELVDGTVMEKPMVQLEHEKLEVWLIQVVGSYITGRNLGILLGSRSPVQISEFRGRMPDLFFVANDRLEIVGQKATRGAPDLIIEIISPHDRPSDINALETDYRSIGVQEIVFIDQRKRRVRVLRRGDEGYITEVLTDGALALITVENLSLPLTWLLNEPRPVPHTTVATLLDGEKAL